MLIARIIDERLNALRTAFDFYRELFETIGFELYTDVLLYDEEGRSVRLSKASFTPTNVVDITDPKSVVNYWASNYASANNMLEELELFASQQCGRYYCDYNGQLADYEEASVEDHRVILNKLTEAEQLMAKSRAIREMVQM